MASAGWGRVAAARGRWAERVAVWTRAATETILEAGHLRPDMHVLDLASGPGEPAIPIAAALGPMGSIIATDPEPEMLAVISERAAARKFSALTCQQAEAEHLSFPSATFDLVTCRFGVMHFSDPNRAVREAHRVLVGGGRLVLLAWGPWKDSSQFPATLGVVARHLSDPPDVAGSHQFRFADPEGLAALLRQAGFRHSTAEFRDVPWCWPGKAEEVWQCIQETAAGTTRKLLDAIPEDRRTQVDREVLEAIRKYESGGFVQFRARLVLACGEKG